MMHPLESSWRGAWKPSDRRPPWQWCEDHVRVDDTSPMPGRWRSDNSPWVKEPMEVFADSGVNELAVMCAAQSSKTQTIMCCLMWAVSQDPGPMQWVMAAADEARGFARTRLLPTLRNCDAVNALLGDEEPGLTEINFPGAAFLLTGANSRSKLQSNPKRYLFLDEVRNYPPGAYEMVRKRVRAFWNGKICTISTPDKADDHVHRAYLAGDRRQWHFECPHCGQLQTLVFRQLKWDENDVTRPGGRWDFDELAKTVRYECIGGCGRPIPDLPAHRKHIASRGRWVRTNVTAPSNKVSFQWSALLPPWVKWRDIVEEFISSYAVLKLGDFEPYKSFVNETLGEPWEDRLKEVTDFGALAHRRGVYTLSERGADGTVAFSWPEEKSRLLAVDVQKDHFRFVCRAFGPGGASRLVAFGRVDTEAELAELPTKLGVPAYNVMLDSGHEAARVYRICSKQRWKAMKGTPHEYFPAVDGEGKRIRRMWSLTHADPALGTPQQGKVKPIRLYLWSNPAVKDMLAEWMNGLGPDWTIALDEGAAMRDYIRQVTAEQRVEKTDARGRVSYEWVQVRRDNHYWDCECMITVAAFIAKLVGQPEVGAGRSQRSEARGQREESEDGADGSDVTNGN